MNRNVLREMDLHKCAGRFCPLLKEKMVLMIPLRRFGEHWIEE